MAANYQYPNRATLIDVAQTLVLDTNNSNPIFQYYSPVVARDVLTVQWRIQDNYKGLMALRGAGGPPIRVNTVGETIYDTEPGVYGEFDTIDEIQLMKLGGRGATTGDVTVDVTSEVADRQANILARQRNRIRQVAWTLARTGSVGVPLPGGGIGYREAYSAQSFTVPTLWSDKAASVPLSDFMGVQQTYGIGTSNRFNTNAVAIMNTFTSQLLFTNRNAADWGGKRTLGGGTVQGMGYYNIVRADLMTPEIVVWDDGYINDAGSFVLDIPNGEVLLIAQRPDGQKPAEFTMTYNAVSKAPGAYTEVFDYSETGNTKNIPPRIEVHAGFNGGIAPFRPSQVVRMIVA